MVGLGNEIVGDDGIGIEAARQLEALLAGCPAVDVVALPWAGLSLLDVLVGRQRAALIDCLQSGRYAPGSVVRLEVGDLSGATRLLSFHDIDLPTALDLGRRLGWPLPEEIALWGVEAERAEEFGVGLSAPVFAALPELVAEVLEFLDDPSPTRPGEPT